MMSFHQQTGEQDMTEEEDLEIPTLTASPDAETTMLFTSHPEQGCKHSHLLLILF